jgi:hypothetical protein
MTRIRCRWSSAAFMPQVHIYAVCHTVELKAQAPSHALPVAVSIAAGWTTAVVQVASCCISCSL